MNYWSLILWILLALGLLLLFTLYFCYSITFFSSRIIKMQRKYPIPLGKIYLPYKQTLINWMKEVEKLPSQKVEITSFDGLTLRGTYYEYAPGAPVELMFPGYRGNSRRDLCGGVQRCFALGHNALLVDQRANGNSEGHIITFGVYESRDCRAWVDFAINRFGPDVKIILTGISMGAATVLITAGGELPSNVIGVLADCGFTSARDIIHKVMGDLKLPPKLLYPFVKLGARVFGGFALESISPVEALKNCKIPVIFFHGDDDRFVPCRMSKENFDACASQKKLVIIPKAGHGLSYVVDREGYIEALKDFWGRVL